VSRKAQGGTAIFSLLVPFTSRFLESPFRMRLERTDVILMTWKEDFHKSFDFFRKADSIIFNGWEKV
jgi:hypothetical protein